MRFEFFDGPLSGAVLESPVDIDYLLIVHRVKNEHRKIRYECDMTVGNGGRLVLSRLPDEYDEEINQVQG